jgi:hypothetical protein
VNRLKLEALVRRHPEAFGDPDQQATNGGLQPQRLLGSTQEPGPQAQEKLHEADRNQASQDAEDRVHGELYTMHKFIRGHVEERLISQQKM